MWSCVWLLMCSLWTSSTSASPGYFLELRNLKFLHRPMESESEF